MQNRWHSGLWMVAAAAALFAIAGCQGPRPAPAAASHAAGQPAPDQQLFAAADDAAKAMIDAAKAGNRDEMKRLFGPTAMKELVSGDPVQEEKGFEKFAAHVAEQARLDKQADGKAVLHIGKEDWPFPIPIVKAADGKWFFDTDAGRDEILARRIGRDELATIKVCRDFVFAQREYASKDRDGNGVLSYAQHYWSTPGQKNGLYWEAAPGEEQSPASAMVAQRVAKGYAASKSTTGRTPYQGYYFHILTRQGPAAPGGRYNYVINGNMIAGFALVAYPAKYRSSGVMTFTISHNGKLYEKDLGPDTEDIARRMTEYNPDATWNLVKE